MAGANSREGGRGLSRAAEGRIARFALL
jgi:hypothetical protein